MKWTVTVAALSIAACAGTPAALADGQLNIFNWGNYTSPELIKKFEETYKVKVTVTDYDSNDTALAKVKAGGHGFDIVVPSASFVPIWISEGLVQETRPDQMENFKNMDPKWVDVPFDPGRHYSVPWQWGTTGMTVNTKVYPGDPNTSAIFLNPPDALKGKVNVVPEMVDVINLTLFYVGSEPCTSDKAALKKARDALIAAKPNWLSMDYGNVEKYAKGDMAAGRELEWRVIPGAAAELRHRLWLSQGGISDLDGQCHGAQGRQEHRQCQAVPELHHGPAERGHDLGICPLCQWHQGLGSLYAARI